MYYILIVMVCLLSTSATFAQEIDQKSQDLRNTVFLEAFGNGLLGSINYERQLIKKPYLITRVGVGFYTESSIYLTIPVSFHYLIALNQNGFLETGIGATWAEYSADDRCSCDIDSNTDDYINVFLSLGYRKHFGRQWMWKINFSPIITNNHDINFTPWLGIAIGKRF